MLSTTTQQSRVIWRCFCHAREIKLKAQPLVAPAIQTIVAAERNLAQPCSEDAGLRGQDAAQAFERGSQSPFSPALWLGFCEKIQMSTDLSAHDIRTIFRALFVVRERSWLPNERLVQARLIGHLCSESLRKVTTFSPTDIAQTLHALSYLGRHALLVKKLCRAARQKAVDFGPSDIALTLDALATFRVQGGVIRTLCEQATRKLHDFSQGDCVMVLFAIARLDLQEFPLVSQLCAMSLPKLASFQPHEIAITLEALQLLKLYEMELFRKLCAQLLLKVSKFKSKDTARAFRALTKSGKKKVNLMMAVLHQVLKQILQFSPQEIDSLLECFLLVKVAPYKDLVQHICLRIFQFEDSNSLSVPAIVLRIQVLSWFRNDDYMRLFCQRALVQAGNCTAQDIADILGAVAMCVPHDLEVAMRFIAEATNKASLFDAVSMDKVLRSLDYFDLYEPALVKALCAVLDTKLDGFAPEDAARILYGLFKLGVNDEALFEKVTIKVVTAPAHRVRNPSVANMWELLACCVPKNRTVVEKLAAQTMTRTNYVLTELVTIIFNMCQLQYYDLACYQKLVSLLEARLKTSYFPFASRVHLTQCRTCLQLEQPTWPPLPADPSTELIEDKGVTDSEFQDSVSTTLTNMGLVHSNEVSLGGFKVDIQLVDGRVIEVDGKYHFDLKKQYTGRTLFKHRMLRAMGFEVFSVNGYQWHGLSAGQQREYLTNMLARSKNPWELGGETSSSPPPQNIGAETC